MRTSAIYSRVHFSNKARSHHCSLEDAITMSSCCEAPKSSLSPSSKKESSSESAQKDSAVVSWIDSFVPVFSALLHSSCCWLPTLLDLTSIGSASAATVSNLRPIFLSITVLILLDSLRRQGFNRHNLIRILASGLVLVLPKVLGYYQKAVAIDAPKHSCH